MWSRKVATYFLCAYCLVILVAALPFNLRVGPLYTFLRAAGLSPGESPFTEHYPVGYRRRSYCLQVKAKEGDREFIVFNTAGCPVETALPYTDPMQLSVGRILGEVAVPEKKEAALRSYFCSKLSADTELTFRYSKYEQVESAAVENVINTSVKTCQVYRP